MAKAKNAQTVSAHIPTEIAEELERRASATNSTRSRFIAEMLINWYEKGAPPINELDAFKQGQAADRAENPGVLAPGGHNVLGNRGEPDEQKGKAQ